MATEKTIPRLFSVLFVAVSLLALTFSAAGVTLVRAATLTVTNTNDSGAGSLRKAIADAAPGDTITFRAALSGETIHLASTLSLEQDVIINGSALALKITISGDTDNNGTGDVSVFWVASGVTATLNSMIITKGATPDMGGIYNLGTLTITNSTLSGNTAMDYCGGAIYNNGTLTLTNSTLSGNSAEWAGGIANDGDGTMTITNSTLTDNNGGGISNYGTLTVTSSTISGNSVAAGYGGGIENWGALTITDSALSGNSVADGYGGGIYTDFGTLTVTNSTLSGNSAGNGGGIHIAADGTGIVTNSMLSGNSANYGGGVSNEGTLTVTNSTISGNTATDYGGGGFSNFGGALTITNSTLSGNIAAGSIGGGIDSESEGTLTVTNSTLSGNSATEDGGGIYNSSGVLTVENSTFSDNTATDGGGIYNYYGTLNYTNTIIANSTLGSDCYNDVTATIGTNANNLVEDGSCSAGGVNLKTGDPNLGPLANNGGSTQTFALLPGSPAIDAGSNTYCPLTDQRGVDRPKDGDGNGSVICDIGAFESNTHPTISDITDKNTNEDTATGAITFTVGDVETPVASLTVTATSSNTTLVPNGNISLGGSGANRTINITPASNQNGTTTITVIVNDGTDTTSDTFLLTVSAVNDLPTISDIGNQGVDKNMATGDITFTVGDVETPAVSLIVTAASSNTTLVPNGNITLGGSGASRTINITPASDQVGKTTITVTMNDGADTASDTFLLAVDITAPTVEAIALFDANPTNLSNVDFTVTFSEPVTGVDVADFKLTNTILTGAFITSITGTGPYTVTVNTGTGNGTTRLDIRATASIEDLVGNAFVGPYTGGETYVVNKGTAPTVPVLVSPANNALVTDYLPTLDWNDSSEVIALANDWSYEVNVTAPLGVYDQTFNTPSGLSNSSYTFTTPLPTNTTFTWKVRAYNDANQYSAWSAARTFRTKPPSTQLAAPTLISPNGTLDNKRPTFEWSDVPGTTTYTLQILDGVKVINTGTIKAPLHTYTPAADLLPSKTYQWKVKANGTISSDYSTPFTFTTSAANPPTIPVLTLPVSNALVDGTAVQTLKWNPVSATVTNPAAASYEVEYAANSAFTGSTTVSVVITQQPIAIGALSPNLTYYWHVRSVSAAGNHSAWSVARTFRTMLSTPVLNLPVDGAVLDNKRPTFTWDEIPGATTYTLQILIGTKVVNTGTIKTPAYVYSPAADLLPSTTYQWKVKANGTNTGNFSAPFAFTTSGNPPKMPVLSAPASNALVDSAVAQILKWNPVLAVTTASPATTYPAALSYEVEYAMNSSFTGASDTLVTVDAPATQTLPITLSPGRTYYWRVRAWSGAGASGSHSAWSLVRMIKVKFVAPTLGATPTGSGDLTFTWTSANGLWTNYTLTIINATTNKVVKSFTVPAPTTTYTVSAALLPAGTYRWQVKINGLYTPISSAVSVDTFSK